MMQLAIRAAALGLACSDVLFYRKTAGDPEYGIVVDCATLMGSIMGRFLRAKSKILLLVPQGYLGLRLALLLIGNLL